MFITKTFRHHLFNIVHVGIFGYANYYSNTMLPNIIPNIRLFVWALNMT